MIELPLFLHTGVETDIRLNHPFTCLGVANVLRVISAILTEQSILFVSSSYYLPTYVIKVINLYEVVHNYTDLVLTLRWF